MNFLISFVLISVEIALGLCLNVNSIKFKLYKFNGCQSVKFTPNFESMFLSESFRSNCQTFSILKCLSLSLKNSSIKAITYQVNDDSTIDCKSYSIPIIELTDLITTSDPVKLYLSNDISSSKTNLTTIIKV